MIKERVEQLQAERPKHWRHIESPFDLPEAIAEAHKADKNSLFVIDSLSQWISNEIARKSGLTDDRQLLDSMSRDIDDCVKVITNCLATRPVIVVSADFGQSMPPQIAADRALRMFVGTSNTRLAEISGAMEVILAGVVIYKKTGQIPNR
jgi:adenosylcobinamide kinase/adenosylcobinamide-phosphate guanylyltransferase